MFHSPTYRKRYAEFLKIDFPRVPLTSDKKLFWKLVELGRELVALHLLEFEGDVYGHTLTVEFISRLREERRFPSLQDLVDQIRRDLEASLAVIKEFEEHHSQNHIS